MTVDGRLIIDTDTHVTEPRDLWTSRLPKKWGDQVLHVKWNPRHNLDYWYIGDEPVFSAWGSANYGWSGGPLSIPPTQDETKAAAWDASARLAEMDRTGIYAQVLYPNLGAVAMTMYTRMESPELRLASVRAYNDFLIDWISPAPERFVPMACLPLWDAAETVAEIHRAAKIGHKGLVFSGSPHVHGWPMLGDRSWDPVWAAAAEVDLPISFHCGGGDVADDFMNPQRFRTYGLHAHYVRSSTTSFMQNGETMVDLLMSGVLARYPTLKFAIVESGIGYVKFCLESLDYHFKVAELNKHRPEFQLLPSEYFRRQIYVNYWFERLEDWHVQSLGADNILFETDFPHTTCLGGPDAVKAALANGLDLQPKEVQDKILWRNAAALYKVKRPAALT